MSYAVNPRLQIPDGGGDGSEAGIGQRLDESALALGVQPFRRWTLGGTGTKSVSALIGARRWIAILTISVRMLLGKNERSKDKSRI